MNGSCAIPLKISDPEFAILIAWSFVGFSAQATADPSCLLVFGCKHNRVHPNLSSISICTHFGEKCVDLTPNSTLLSQAETISLSEAVIFSLNSDNIEYFGDVIPIFSAGLDLILSAGATSDLMIKPGDSNFTWLNSGTSFAPEFVILRSANSYTCKPIRAVHFNNSNRASATLTADTPLDMHSITEAILSGHGQYAIARVIGAM